MICEVPSTVEIWTGVLGHYPIPSAEEPTACIMRSLEDEGSRLLLNTGNYQPAGFLKWIGYNN
jgi:hypothetical protein